MLASFAYAKSHPFAVAEYGSCGVPAGMGGEEIGLASWGSCDSLARAASTPSDERRLVVWTLPSQRAPEVSFHACGSDVGSPCSTKVIFRQSVMVNQAIWKARNLRMLICNWTPM